MVKRRHFTDIFILVDREPRWFNGYTLYSANRHVLMYRYYMFPVFNSVALNILRDNRGGKRRKLTVSDLCCYSRGTLLQPKASCRVSGSSTVSLVSLKSKRKLGFRLCEPLNFQSILVTNCVLLRMVRIIIIINLRGRHSRLGFEYGGNPETDQ